MPRIRTIKPDIWKDDKVGVLSHLARLLWIGLITQADDDGRLWCIPRIIRIDIFPYDDSVKDQKVEELLNELARACLIVIYETDCGRKAIQIKRWADHQRINRKTDSSIPAPDNSLITHGGFTEDSPPEGNGMEGKGRDMSEIPSDAPRYPEGSLPYVLADYLQAQIRENNPTAKLPDLLSATGQKWCDVFRLMIERDDREPDLIAGMIKWCQQDDFWCGNILSPGKLREKWDTLVMQATRNGKPLPRLEVEE